MLVIFLELCLAVSVGWFFISQLIIPTLKNQPLFPAIRKAPPEVIQNEIKTVEEELEAAALAEKLEAKKEQLTKKRSKKSPQ